MSATTHLPTPSPGSAGAPSSGGAGRAAISPYRPVLFVALVLFAPALRETLEGNMPVQTALIRFIGSVAVSFIVIRLVLSVVESYAAKRDSAAATSAAATSADRADGAHEALAGDSVTGPAMPTAD